MSEIFPPPTELLPHRGAMLMIDRVVSATAEELVALGGCPLDNPLVHAGYAPALVAIEIAAQGAAILETLRQRAAGTGALVRKGYLVGLRNARFGDAFRAGHEVCEIRVRADAMAPPLALFEGLVRVDGQEVFAGTISAYLQM